jgi:hypothetical protein
MASNISRFSHIFVCLLYRGSTVHPSPMPEPPKVVSFSFEEPSIDNVYITERKKIGLHYAFPLFLDDLGPKLYVQVACMTSTNLITMSMTTF